jgi:hypothetical protein
MVKFSKAVHRPDVQASSFDLGMGISLRIGIGFEQVVVAVAIDIVVVIGVVVGIGVDAFDVVRMGVAGTTAGDGGVGEGVEREDVVYVVVVVVVVVETICFGGETESIEVAFVGGIGILVGAKESADFGGDVPREDNV